MDEYLKKHGLEWLSENWKPLKVNHYINKDK